MNQRNKVKDLTTFNTRVLSYKYLGPTNFKGSRVKIADPRFNKSKTIPFEGEWNHASEVAVDYLLQNGWVIVGINSDIQVIILKDFDSDQQLDKR